MRFFLASLLVFGSFVAACSSSDATPETTPEPAADGGGGDPEAAAPDAPLPFVEAKFPAFPQFVNRGGPVIKAPKFKAVTLAADPNAAALEDIVAKLAASSYWVETMTEYGVGPAKLVAPVRVPGTPAPLYGVTAFETLLETEFAKANGGLMGPPDTSTIYTLFLPAGSRYTLPNAGTQTVCPGVQGFHSHYKRPGDAMRITYSVVGTCGAGHENLMGLDAVATTTSHEFAEAASDPYIDQHAWYGMDPAHAIWNVLLGEKNTGGEIGDTCDFDPSFFFKPADSTRLVQRMWSNKAAANGAVCNAPGAATIAVRKVVPVMKDKVTFTSAGQPLQTLGVKLAIGQSTTIDVILSSDVPTEPWDVKAYGAFNVEVGPKPTKPTLELTLDKASGKNGDVLKLTIKLLALDPVYGAAPFQVRGTTKDGKFAGLYFGVVAPK